uniref:Uncharacterized protein n=1 Tax=Tetranychus urticae TaxID=32264 RepID=T1KNB6_TETUR
MKKAHKLWINNQLFERIKMMMIIMTILVMLLMKTLHHVTGFQSICGFNCETISCSSWGL